MQGIDCIPYCGGIDTEMATMTSKGQMTIPMKVRIEMALDVGDKIVFIKREKAPGYIIMSEKDVEHGEIKLDN
jgi:bifunctional DNA-binding transcriptional regulator/antitoxin component of YhaV-PrlF toxin-antitoxin module